MNSVNKFFKLAARNCFKGNFAYTKKYKIGAIGIRKDGTIVKSHNIPCRDKSPDVHAERRLCRKLDQGSTVYVVRIGGDNKYKNCRPCAGCQAVMRNKGVSKCYYSINSQEYGVMTF
jgi:cytidine deaminase